MSESVSLRHEPAPATASSARRQRIRLIAVHETEQPAADLLAQWTAAGAVRAPHYFVAGDGSVTELVPEQRAAHYVGIATLGKRRRNIDRIALTIVVEQPGKRAQARNLRALVEDLQQRYELLADAALLRWTPGTTWQAGTLQLFELPRIARRQVVLGLEEQERHRQALLSIADDPATAQRLWVFLEGEAFRQRGDGYKNGSAFHLHAAKNGMGAALAPSSPRSAWVSVGGRQFNYQHFAHDTAFNEGEAWTAVQNLSATLQGSLPAPGSVEYLLLESAYKTGLAASKTAPSGNIAFNPTWASTQLAITQQLGPALSGAYRIGVDGAVYSIQVFAADTLYTPIANPESATAWSDVRRLSDTPAGALREQLWAETYKPSGVAYDTQAPFQQHAAQEKLGAPLSGVYQATFEGTPVSIQVFALDTLHQVEGGPITRQSSLPVPPEVSGWAPRPAKPAPVVDTTTVVALGNFTQPAGDRTSPAWPALLNGLTALVDTATRQHVFGPFEYVAAPLPGNAEHIRILGTWQQDNIVNVRIPQLAALNAGGVRSAPASGTIQWHRLAVKQLLQLWAAWEQAGLLDRIQTWDGSYNPRFIRGSTSVLSNHAFGTAFDINARTNMLGSVPALCGHPGCVRELVAIANQFGFYWGGHFPAPRLDGMHFEIARIL